MTRYFALTDRDRIIDLGEYEDEKQAFRAAPSDAPWLLDDAALRLIRDDINTLLGNEP